MSQNNIPCKQHLRTAEAARYCQVSKSFLEQRRIRGNGPSFFKLGKTVVYSTDDLVSWMETQRRMSTSENGGSCAA